MAEKPIRLEYEDGRVYVLEFSAQTVRDAEEGGFDYNLVESRPVTMIPLLFYYSFKLHQPEITKEETDKIFYDDLGGLSKDLQARLVKLYVEHIAALTRKGGGTKNAKMKVV